MGISYVAMYSADLTVAASGKHEGRDVGKDYQAEFNRAFEFAAKYAGYAAYPSQSPGAWIAFRQSQTNFSPSDYGKRVTDYSMHITLENPRTPLRSTRARMAATCRLSQDGRSRD